MFPQIILFLTGLFFLLFGMVRMSDELQQVLGLRIRQWIKYLSKNPFCGIGLGTVATGIFQCSATTVLLAMGLVGAGLITFTNSLGIVLGADIGTTVTALLVAFKFTKIASYFIIIGIILWFTGRKTLQKWGEIIFYFGLLFFGLNIISQTITPLKANPVIMQLFQKPQSPLMGILIGFIFTVICQSSSATISILILFAQQGLVGLNTALPIILGANIGTTITPFLLSFRGGINARRTGLSHFLFKFIWITIAFFFLPVYTTFIQKVTPDIAQQIAQGHLLFNVFMTVFFALILVPFAKLVKKIIPGHEKIISTWVEYLDPRYLSQPALALEGIRKELERGACIVEKMYFKSLEVIRKFKTTTVQNVFYIEMVIDNLQAEVMRYLDKLPKSKLTRKEIADLIHFAVILDNIERTADHVVNLAKLGGHRIRTKVQFSKAGREEVKTISKAVAKNIRDIVLLIEGRDGDRAERVIKREEKIDQMIDVSKQNHIERFYQRAVSAADGPIFNDVLVNLERISDHCENIAEVFIERKEGEVGK